MKTLTITDIDNKFTNYKFPMLNWVRLPSIKISNEEKSALGLKPEDSNFEFLKAKAREGFKNRKSKNQIVLDKKNEYFDRLKEELDLIDELGFTDYYLLVWKTIEQAKKYTSYIDPARGSCAGSCVFYMIGVTQVDPVRHSLFLSRFISKARANKKEIDGITYIQGDLAPDVDLNFAKDIREKIISWLETEYGGKLAKIATYTSFTTKILLKEVYKSMTDESTEEEAKDLSNEIESKFGKLQSLEEGYENSAYLKRWADQNPEHFKIAKQIRNLPKNVSSHASGYVVSFEPLNKVSQVILNKDGELTCVYEMNDISKLSLKLDLLGLTTNKIIDDCLKLVGKTYDDINLIDDPKIYRHFQDEFLGTGIYQVEKGCGYNTTNAVKPKSIDELGDVNALARPGALSYLSDYVNNAGECPHKIFRPILATTRYQPLYQEQMIQMAIAIGFTPEEGEIIRRVVGKKKKDQVAEWEPKVRQKCIDNGHGTEVAEYFWKLLEESADYSFNKSHSLGVSYVGALTMYLKYNHPLEFYTSFLNNCKEFPDYIEKTSAAIRELKHFNIKILSPDILKSKEDFTIEGNCIRYGLRYIKGISDKSLPQLLEFQQYYKNKFEVFRAVDEYKIKLNVICPLIQAGALEYDNKTRSYVVLEMQTWKNLTEKEKNIVTEYGEQFDYDLMNIIRHCRDNNLIKESRLNTLRKKIKNYQEIYNINKTYSKLADWYYEYKLLGFSYSYDLSEVFKSTVNFDDSGEDKFCSLMELTCSDELDYNQKYSTVGMVVEKKLATSKNGNKYLRLLIEDGKYRLDVFLMDGKYGRIQSVEDFSGRLPEENDMVICVGKMKEGSNNLLFADLISIQTVNIFTKLHELKTYQKSNI